MYSENIPPAGVSMVSKRIDTRTVEFVTTRDSKEVLTQHVTLSSDGKTMRIDAKGVNAQGEQVQSLLVLEKQ
jgi:hypothetical protein